MSNKTPNQILEEYRQRLTDRKNWLREKIWILTRRGSPHGYESQEFYAVQWVLTFIESQEKLALEHINNDLQKRNETKAETPDRKSK